jgi:ABC-type multidrug transport system fused ATPase/permease subunit
LYHSVDGFLTSVLVNQAGTVRNSILFGKPYDEQLYKQVIHACALERDLEIMPQGDMSMISERGTNLSGGTPHMH